jgi:hypothetical protein
MNFAGIGFTIFVLAFWVIAAVRELRGRKHGREKSG